MTTPCPPWLHCELCAPTGAGGVGAADDEQTLIELLRVGVDMYCPDNASAELLLALMRRMLHRQVRRTETPTKAGPRARPQRARPSPIDRIPGRYGSFPNRGGRCVHQAGNAYHPPRVSVRSDHAYRLARKQGAHEC